jgi:hypothetical protein
MSNPGLTKCHGHFSSNSLYPFLLIRDWLKTISGPLWPRDVDDFLASVWWHLEGTLFNWRYINRLEEGLRCFSHIVI